MSTFNVGDLVSLQSGGVAATVIDVNPKGTVSIAWFSQQHEYHTAQVPPNALKGLLEDEDYQKMIELRQLNNELQLSQLKMNKQEMTMHKNGLVNRPGKMIKA